MQSSAAFALSSATKISDSNPLKVPWVVYTTCLCCFIEKASRALNMKCNAGEHIIRRDQVRKCVYV